MSVMPDLTFPPNVIAPLRSGPAIQLTYYGANKSAKLKGVTEESDLNLPTMTFPYYKDFTISATQETRAPIEELYKVIKDAVTQGENTKHSMISSIISAAQQASDILGTKVAGKGFYALSWKKGSNGNITLSINLHRGWMGIWRAKSEVIYPLMRLKSRTVPFDDGNTLFSPMPSPLGVYAAFGSQVINSALSAPKTFAGQVQTVLGLSDNDPKANIGQKAANAALNAVGEVSEVISGWVDGGLDKIGSFLSSRGIGGGGLWRISHGHWDYTSHKFYPYYTINDCICDSSTISLSKEKEMDQNGNFYPIFGTIDLTLKTQSVTVHTDFTTNDNKIWGVTPSTVGTIDESGNLKEGSQGYSRGGV